jgi:ATP-dependent Clp protease ATP-binding subunit ClpA
VTEIEVVVSRMARVPVKSVTADDKVQLASLEPELKKVIFGQDHAIEQVVSAIKLQRSGLGPQERPIGSFLFSGPTGVGKTELAKQLARVMGVSFLRFDMSEYMEKHTVSRLIGAPPGYVGFDQGGLLTDAVRKTPYVVLLLDEIEKAHPDVFNILLQVMDHAKLTDNNGRVADFRHVVLVLTTNAGAMDLSVEGIGFGSGSLAGASGGGKAQRAIERTFSPEFRNRLDAWVAFNGLTHRDVERVVDKFVGELAEQLAAKKVTLTLTPKGREWFAEKGFSKAMGARPMARLLAQELKRPISEALLFGELQGGGSVVVDAPEGTAGKLHLRLDGAAPAEKVPPKTASALN